jgi:hypothetical protein
MQIISSVETYYIGVGVCFIQLDHQKHSSDLSLVVILCDLGKAPMLSFLLHLSRDANLKTYVFSILSTQSLAAF